MKAPDHILRISALDQGRMKTWKGLLAERMTAD